MAGYRQFHTKFWKDEWLIDLEPLERYLFCYLFTNDLSSISGIYKLPMKVIVNETGLDREYIETTLDKFQSCKKIFYRDGIMWVVKMQQYHKNASPKTMTKVYADVAEIPECDVKKAYRYYQSSGKYCIDTVSIQIPESLSLSERENKSASETPPPPSHDFPDDAWVNDEPFEQLRLACQKSGIEAATAEDSAALTRMVKDGVTVNDVLAGIAWKSQRMGDKPIFSVSQIEGPAKTAKNMRLQKNGNGHGQKMRILKDANGNILEVPE